tara:strand:- start:20665 stop:21399 length:735 start_codon:yes stop_codon:yes gene_type:complete
LIQKNKMKIFGLIGIKLENSFSKKYFINKFKKEKITKSSYFNFNLRDVADLKSLIIEHNISGLNVTMPYKEKIIPFLDGLNEDAKLIGAVNTIKVDNKKLIGYNTDHIGFAYSLLSNLNNRKRALILGNGGAAKAVKYVLKNNNIQFKVVSRNTHFDYLDINQKIMNDYEIIINTTPLGSLAEINRFPNIPYKYISKKHLLFDIIYNPKETKFLEYGKRYNALTINGLQMLKIQAEESWKIWNL